VGKANGRVVMRVLHVVKTAEGASWAVAQAAELVRCGVDVHVALPGLHGRMVPQWRGTGATLHVTPTDITLRGLAGFTAAANGLRDLVAQVRPDLIHSHFVSSTLLLRVALGAKGSIPRLFQVPGPLHLEHPLWRWLELSTAGPCDRWIASSRCILRHYQAAGVADQRLYLSYYGTGVGSCSSERTGVLRRRLGIDTSMKIVGNANFIYPPKWYLGEYRGLKAHEDVIDALGLVVRKRNDVMGVLLGGTFPKPHSYERWLRRRALRVGGGRILMPGYFSAEEIREMWPDFDVAVHVPTSENCGGVIEPMLAGVPTIAGRVGGLAEVVIDGVTGTTIPIRDPVRLAEEIFRALNEPERCGGLRENGQALVREMFDVQRTAGEVLEIYRHVLQVRKDPPPHFDPRRCLSRAGLRYA
jgi:glycosyltransferase involved in cell wall biosynthesis